MKHTTAICVALFCLECSATAGSLFVQVKNAPSAPSIITFLVDDGSDRKPLIVTRQVSPSEAPVIQQIDLAREATYRVRAAVLSPDRQTLRISAVAAVQNVHVALDSTSSVDLAFTPVILSVQHSSSGGNETYSASLNDTTAFFTDRTATGVLSITSGQPGQLSVKRYFSRLSDPSAGTTWNATFLVPSATEQSTYDLMLYFPELSDSGRMAVVEFPWQKERPAKTPPPCRWTKTVHTGVHPDQGPRGAQTLAINRGSGSSASEPMGGLSEPRRNRKIEG